MHELERANRLSELLAIVHIGNHCIEAGGHDAERATREHDALKVQARHQNLDPATFAAQHILCRDFTAFEHQLASVGPPHAELVQLLRGRKALEPFFDDESCDAARARICIRLGIDDQRVCVRAIGNPHLAAVENVVIAPVLGVQLHAHNIGPCIGL